MPIAMMMLHHRRFGHILWVACSRVAEEDVSLCLCSCSSSDRLVGRDWAVAKRMRTLPLEVRLQSAQLVGQPGDSPSSLEDVRLVAEAEGVVATLALSKVQCVLSPLPRCTPGS